MAGNIWDADVTTNDSNQMLLFPNWQETPKSLKDLFKEMYSDKILDMILTDTSLTERMIKGQWITS